MAEQTRSRTSADLVVALLVWLTLVALPPEAAAADPAVYTNDDLPPPLPATRTLPLPPPLPAGKNAEDKREPAPVPPVTVRQRLEAIREEIARAEREEWKLIRFLSCVQRGLELTDPGCHPRPNVLPRRKVRFLTPTEKSMTRQLREIRTELERLRRIEAERLQLLSL